MVKYVVNRVRFLTVSFEVLHLFVYKISGRSIWEQMQKESLREKKLWRKVGVIRSGKGVGGRGFPKLFGHPAS